MRFPSRGIELSCYVSFACACQGRDGITLLQTARIDGCSGFGTDHPFFFANPSMKSTSACTPAFSIAL